jgi:nucleoside-diphosphate-sugar epimerase
MTPEISGKKILVTGGTGQMARPAAEMLARSNEVWCLARFSDAETKRALEAADIVTVPWDMLQSDLSDVPRDFTHVIHAAVIMEFRDSDTAIRRTCEATADLISHCPDVEAFLHFSSSVIYQYVKPGHLYGERDVVGALSTPNWMPAYGGTKIAAEGTVHALSHTLGIPSTIARISVAYGFPKGVGQMQGGLVMRYVRLLRDGLPVPTRPAGESACSLLHSVDIVRHVPALLEAASVPPTIVNWGGDEAVDEREIVRYVAELTGLRAEFEESDAAPRLVALDPTLRRNITGPCTVSWRDGVRDAISEYFPELLR